MPELLACPSCRGPLRRENETLICSCSAWPVVADIPLLVPWARNRRFGVAELLARHRPVPSGIAGKLLRRIITGESDLENSISRRDATFIELADAFGRTRDLDYFRYRFSDLSYLCTAALLTPLSRGPVLDLGCGAGHTIHALLRRLPKSLVVGIDLNFALLYLSKRFVAPSALLVCADASCPLPLLDGAFEGAVCADVFQYLPEATVASRELMRVTRGPILLSHVYGRGTPTSLTPERCLELFAARQPRLYRERDLLDAFFERRELDLRRCAEPVDDLMAATIGVEPRIYPGANYFVSGAALNPLYEVRKEGDELHLRRRFLSEAHAEKYRQYESHLPERLTVTREQIAMGDPDLVKKFILLDLPPNYC